jgi:hypothetical protein
LRHELARALSVIEKLERAGLAAESTSDSADRRLARPHGRSRSSGLVSSINLGMGCMFDCSESEKTDAHTGERTLECPYRYLPGPLPREIGLLTCAVNITGINFMVNMFTGTIPTEWRSLTRLKQLNLQANLLTGQVPAWLFKDLANLRMLDLHRNSLNGTIPTTIGSLKALTVLDMSENLLTGTLPSHVGQLPNLHMCQLNDNKLRGPLPESLGNLGQTLWLLEAESNLFTGRTGPTV